VKNNLKIPPKPVRIFHRLVLKNRLPDKPKVDRIANNKTTSKPDRTWKSDYFECFESKIKGVLENQSFQVAYDRESGIKPFENQRSTYLVPFLVSKVWQFASKDIRVIKRGPDFKIKEDALKSVQEALAQTIRGEICENFMIHELVFDKATSRKFTFEIYYEGSFRVKWEFSSDDVKSKRGVRIALESFFDEVISEIEPFGFQVSSKSSRHQRMSSNEYLFDVYYQTDVEFNENEVIGEGGFAVRGDASIDEINTYGVDFENVFEDEANEYLKSVLDENLPSQARLIFSKISYIDDSGEVVELCDELMLSEK